MTGSAPVLRPAQAREAPLLAALAERAYAHYVPVIGRRPAPMDDDYDARIVAGQAHVLERDGRILGLVVIEDRPGHLWLDNIAVEPEARGQGLGGMLLDFVEAEARRRGFRELRLLTNERMEANLVLYRNRGFAEVERREQKGFRRIFLCKALM
ncbi:GNAT family N-acetyltransferase [Roseomonas gilardii]|uniref:GNAT family N-acetyltransferase n=1 Tax=Roseomonas gilardii TaxID=257708 RepID=UPI000480B3C1|nr:GNAT family N-acetyltransferase [Roseomonas gilardii]SUE62849.1 Predicted acetyltransferase [Roseomonas gilardii subsp. rosea]